MLSRTQKMLEINSTKHFQSVEVKLLLLTGYSVIKNGHNKIELSPSFLLLLKSQSAFIDITWKNFCFGGRKHKTEKCKALILFRCVSCNLFLDEFPLISSNPTVSAWPQVLVSVKGLSGLYSTSCTMMLNCNSP